MTSSRDLSKVKLYSTFYRLDVIEFLSKQNIHIDDSGYVLMIDPDGAIDLVGKLSYCGEVIICTESKTSP